MESQSEEKSYHCMFFVKRKNRFCRFQPKANADYCPEHSCIMGVHDDRKRIPCPLDPSHNCIEDELHKHLKKCNVTKIRQAFEKLPYFVKNINRGESCSTGSAPKKRRVKDLTSDRLQQMIDKVNKLYTETVGLIEKLHLEHYRVKEEIVGDSDQDLTKSFGDQAMLRKEMLQQASLVGQLDNLGFLSDGHSFVELGAGKGKLSHWIRKGSQDCKDTSFLLVERSSVRYKVDSTQQNEGIFQRIKIDIQDLCLGKVSALTDRGSIVVVGKHLCGGATDLGLRCAVNTLDWSATGDMRSDTKTYNGDTQSKDRIMQQDDVTLPSSCNTNSSHCGDSLSTKQPAASSQRQGVMSQNVSNESSKSDCHCQEDEEPPSKQQCLHNKHSSTSSKLEGIMIALCCHHQCTWDTYVGQEFMKRHGIDEDEFDWITRLSSWAVCARTRPKGKTTNKKATDQIQDKETKAQPADNNKSEGKDNVIDKTDHSVEDLIGTMSDGRHLREQLSVVQRERIGLKAKRILDMGRLDYLQSKHMKCFLREYIDDLTTPENIVLVAVPVGQSETT